MANVRTFRAYRYTARAGEPGRLVTQPYDKISPELQARYLAASPHNLVRIILGERHAGDSEADNVYTRAAGYFERWIEEGILAQDAAPGLYPYFQEFAMPDTGERAVRKGFVGLGRLEEYSAGVVFRHEQTLSGPKKDRRLLLDHTRAHFGQIFMLYPDPEGAVDALLDQAARGEPVLEVTDEYQARHRLWRMEEGPATLRIQERMADKKLLIADGHHRYETALGYRRDHPENPAAAYVMMTFVNMHSPGLKILATHRVLRGLERFDGAALRAKAAAKWTVEAFESAETLRAAFTSPAKELTRIGVVTADDAFAMSRGRTEGEMDVPVLHAEVLGGMLGVGEEAVREERHIQYVRGIAAAIAEVREKGAQVAFLLDPAPIGEMARVAFGGGVMPQKSTDFYPKLLSGVTIYRVAP
jgi:uncharacterized protein (DUF1015 family)